jgi:DNA-binding beta-propeller fold protein YncE
MVMPGDEVTYQIRLLNWTDSFTGSGSITHTLPAGFDYVPDSALVTVGGWPITRTEPLSQSGTLAWGPFRLLATGYADHNPYGVHTFVQDLCLTPFIDMQLDQALQLVGSGGYVTQLFYRITAAKTGPDACAVYFVNAAYDRNLVPILRLEGEWNSVGFWEQPDPGPDGDYSEIAAAFARYVAGLPRRNTHPLYVTIWNEPDLSVEWSGQPSAAQYGRFFVAVSSAIRSLGDARIRILNGATTPANTGFIHQLMAVPGFVNAFDAWASHCYPYNHPPRYNIHQHTARYGNAVIDCYIEERDVIARYGGRAGLKFVVTESGYGLGENTYHFEGYSRIDETNRASYIAAAFDSYWRTWPEVIAVTPFELGDPWSGWEWLDWIDYTLTLTPSLHFSLVPHPQFDAVAALGKPRGATVPHGIEVTFRARAAADLLPGIYTSDLAGSAGEATAVLTQTAPVRVMTHIVHTYLPLVQGGQPGGVWYAAQATPEGGGAGGDTIVPTGFLAGAGSEVGAAQQPGSMAASRVPVGGEPRALALDGRLGRAYAALAGGQLAVVNLDTQAVDRRIDLGGEPQALALGPEAGTLYVSLDTGEIVRVDTVKGKVAARAGGLGRPAGLAFDPPTGRLLVADAQAGAILGFSQDLSTRVAAHSLEELPDQLLLDAAGRRLVVTLPGARRVVALDADTLQPAATVELSPGGPLVQAALDPARNRVLVLRALSPDYRGISVLRAGDLAPQALIAGSPAWPLARAAALAALPDGRLVVAEGNVLYWISPDKFEVVGRVGLNEPISAGGLSADPAGGHVAGADSDSISVY